MVLAHEDEGEEDERHPYWYAKVLGIFHANIRVSDNFDVERMDFLWVHWFGRDPDHPGGFDKHRLHCIGLLDPTSPTSFGFLNPQDVLRGVYLIPAFSTGRVPVPSSADNNGTDWDRFYVSM
jgi:hypothetical protein